MPGTVLGALAYTFSSALACSTALYRAGSSYMADNEGMKQIKSR